MTQLFKTTESIKKEKTKRLKEHGVELWRNNAAEYRGLPDKYYELLAQKKASEIKPLKQLRKEILAEYPMIPFLQLGSEEEAKAMLDDWIKAGCLTKEIESIEETLRTNHSINEIKAWCRDYTYTAARAKYALEKKQRMYPKRYKNASNKSTTAAAATP